jgi:hypothetical protein
MQQMKLRLCHKCGAFLIFGVPHGRVSTAQMLILLFHLAQPTPSIPERECIPHPRLYRRRRDCHNAPEAGIRRRCQGERPETACRLLKPSSRGGLLSLGACRRFQQPKESLSDFFFFSCGCGRRESTCSTLSGSQSSASYRTWHTLTAAAASATCLLGLVI